MCCIVLIVSFIKQDAWSICRIFKKPSSVAQRVSSHSWGPQSIATTTPELLSALQSIQASHFALESSSCSANQFNSQQCFQGRQQQKLNSSQDGSSCKVINFNRSLSLPQLSEKDTHSSPIILPFETQSLEKSSAVTSVLLSMAPEIVSSMNEALPNTEMEQLEPSYGYTDDWGIDANGAIGDKDDDPYTRKPVHVHSSGTECGIPRKIKFPFDLGVDSPDDWTSSIPCDSLPCPPPPTEMSNSSSIHRQIQDICLHVNHHIVSCSVSAK